MSEAAQSNLSETSATTTWLVVPRELFARKFDLVRDGQVVATLKMAMFKEACEFALGGHQFAIRRQSIWKDGFVYSCDGAPICTVSHQFWTWRYEINAGDEAWTLLRTSWFKRHYHLMHGEEEVGTIRPAGWFTSKRIAQFSDAVPPPIQVLAIFLVLILGRREQSSGS